jgi:hypothetical protein
MYIYTSIYKFYDGLLVKFDDLVIYRTMMRLSMIFADASRVFNFW